MLEVSELCVDYGGVAAVQKISLEVHEGEIVVLVGPNGAGKTSTIMAISGVVRPSGGSIVLDGRRIDGLASHQIVNLGVAQVPEGRMIFADLTVRENLLLGAEVVGVEPSLDEVLARFPDLAERLDLAAGNLSGGQLQMLAISRALMSRPRLLLLDEPSLGLSPKLVDETFDLVTAVRDASTTVLMVEQNLTGALQIADRAYLLESGEIIASDTAAAFAADPQIAAAYLGIVSDAQVSGSIQPKEN